MTFTQLKGCVPTAPAVQRQGYVSISSRIAVFLFFVGGYSLLFDVIAIIFSSRLNLCRPAGQNNTLTNAEAAHFSGSHLRIELLTLKTKFRMFKKPTILPLLHMKADKRRG